MIKDYINSIGIRKEFNTKKFEDEDYYTFFGDGTGDFQVVSNSSTKEVVEEYIVYCKQQIEIAEKYLNSL